MLKPSVGLISLVSSPLIFKTIVVFPELSRPLHAPQQHQSNLLFYTKKKKKQPWLLRKLGMFWVVVDTYTIRMRISFSFRLILRIMLRSPIALNLSFNQNADRESWTGAATSYGFEFVSEKREVRQRMCNGSRGLFCLVQIWSSNKKKKKIIRVFILAPIFFKKGFGDSDKTNLTGSYFL